MAVKSAHLTLHLLRHAKSAWDDLELDDHERALAPRGLKAAPRMGRYMAAQGMKPDLVLCSDAVRTRATLTLVLPELGKPAPEIRYDNALYLAAPDTILDILRMVDAKHTRVLIIGHNPGIHALALSLTGSGDKGLLAELATRFPTATLATLTFAGKSWKQVAPGTGQLTGFVTPRTIKD